jgi:riboflavin transporter FmnP
MQVGIAGLVLTGAFVVVVLMALWSARSSSWSVLAAGLLIGIGAGAVFIHVVNDPAVAVPLWTLVGLAVAQTAVASGSARTAFTGAESGAAE